ncbi:3-dehydroquinate synthase [Candidatus Woesearchaeota archaeon]|nr:3-dehydroquinate synthase [Candidatus Woesearchaeota archaeon]
MNLPYTVVIGKGAIKELENYRMFTQRIVITEKKMAQLLKPQQYAPDAHILVFKGGEQQKQMKTVVSLAQEMMNLGVDRKSLVIAIGGGVVGDVAGFVASIYMRGIAYIHVPTTLLAMVDSSIGGKTGVDLHEAKNMLGTIYRPRAVISDLRFLLTLPKEEMRNGFAEIIKVALIKDNVLYHAIAKEKEKLLEPSHALLEGIIRRAIKIKLDIVTQDETEQGVRRLLNFGHTVGHAIEAASSYQIKHGTAVAIGMVYAAKLSQREGLLSQQSVTEILELLESMGFPTMLPTAMNKDQLIAGMMHDKKKEHQHIHAVLLKDIGNALIQELPIERWRGVL